MAGDGAQRPSPTVSDILNGLPSGSSGRSSVSLNSLLSDYLMEMQQLAEGTLLSQRGSKKNAPENQASTACAIHVSEALLSRVVCCGSRHQTSCRCKVAFLIYSVLRELRSESTVMPSRRLEAKPWRWMPPLPLTSSCNLWSSSPSAPATPGRSLGFPRCPACRECPSGQQVPASLKLALLASIGKASPS